MLWAADSSAQSSVRADCDTNPEVNGSVRRTTWRIVVWRWRRHPDDVAGNINGRCGGMAMGSGGGGGGGSCWMLALLDLLLLVMGEITSTSSSMASAECSACCLC